MKNILPLLLVFLFAACGPQKGRLRISGTYDNLSQADLLIYSPDGGLQVPVDTLHIQKGRFDYTTRLAGNESHTFVIVYPNFMTLSFQAREGQEVRIRGNALSLGNEVVEGADSVLPPVSHRAPSPLKVGSPLPKNDIIRPRRGTYLLVTFWAPWRYGSGSINYNTRQALADHPDSLHAFTYSLDIDPSQEQPPRAEQDSARWHYRSDHLGWTSPLLARLGIRNIPYHILLDPRGRIRALGGDFNRDIKPALDGIGRSGKS